MCTNLKGCRVQLIIIRSRLRLIAVMLQQLSATFAATRAPKSEVMAFIVPFVPKRMLLCAADSLWASILSADIY